VFSLGVPSTDLHTSELCGIHQVQSVTLIDFKNLLIQNFVLLRRLSSHLPHFQPPIQLPSVKTQPIHDKCLTLDNLASQCLAPLNIYFNKKISQQYQILSSKLAMVVLCQFKLAKPPIGMGISNICISSLKVKE
jgi:hypothetical protein